MIIIIYSQKLFAATSHAKKYLKMNMSYPSWILCHRLTDIASLFQNHLQLACSTLTLLYSPPLFSAVQHIGNAVKFAFNADGITIMQFNGEAAGQTVFHLHVHILPRITGIPLKPHNGTMEDLEIIKKNGNLIRNALIKLAP